MEWKKGTELRPAVQERAINAFQNRYTRYHVPSWAKKGKYPVQFDSDLDWLENTLFAVKNNGELDSRVKHCQSSPTWPDNPELRK